MITSLTLKFELEKRFDLINQSSNDAHFYRSIAEYVDYINRNKLLKEVVNKQILKEYYWHENSINAARKKARKECDKVYKELVFYIKSHDISDPRISTFLSNYKKIADGHFGSNNPTDFYDELKYVISEIVERHLDPALRKYAKILNGVNIKMCTSFLFSPNGLKLVALTNDFKTQREIKIWGAWIDIQRIYLALFEGRDSELTDKHKMLMLGSDRHYEFINLALKHVMNPQNYSTTGLEAELLKRNLYLNQAKRIHFSLCEILRRQIVKQGQNPERYFIFQDDTFYYKGSPIIGLNPERLYYKVVKIIYDKTQGEGGGVSYENIKNSLNSSEIKAADPRVAIRHALSKGQGFFHYAKVNNKPIPNHYNNTKFFQPLKGDGKILFYNPYIT